jgi:hypothetical protein
VLNEPGPKGPPTALVIVDYSESSGKDLTRNFGEVCSLLFPSGSFTQKLRTGLVGSSPIAAFASIAAKRAEWAVEGEVRHVTLIRQDTQFRMKERKARPCPREGGPSAATRK